MSILNVDLSLAEVQISISIGFLLQASQKNPVSQRSDVLKGIK